MSRAHSYTSHSRAHSPNFPLLHLHHNSFSNPSFASPTSQALHLIQSSAHFPTFPPLHLRHNSFSNPSVALPMSQLILQPFHCLSTSQFILRPSFRFFYVTSSSFNSELCSFSNLSAISPTLQLILQPFRRFTYGTAHSPTLLSLLLRHKLFT